MKKFLAYFFITGQLFFLSIFSLLQGCAPSSHPPAQRLVVSKFSALKGPDFDCEEKLKSDIINHNIKFLDVKNLTEEIEFANNLRIENGEETLNIRKQNNEFVEYTHTSVYNSENLSIERNSTIGLNKKDDYYLMYFEIMLMSKTRQQVKTLTQRFGVRNKNKECKLELLKSDLKSFEKSGLNSFHYSEFMTTNKDETLSNISKDFQINPDQELLEFTNNEELKSYDNIIKHTKIVQFLPEVGILEMKIQMQAPTRASLFEEVFSFDSIHIQALSKEKELFSVNAGFNDIQKISYTEMQGNFNYNLPFQKYFSKVHLGEEYVNLSNPKSDLDSEYQKINSTLILRSMNKLSYTPFDAYWTILNEKYEENLESYKFLLQENPSAQAYSKTTDIDLRTNSTIQADLPEIVEIAHQIEIKSTTDRKSKINGILTYLANNYTFDTEMVNNDSIRPLSTKEALERKKGVCQHYSVLFVSIARALKIPSRIILGYLIKGKKVGSHAWVEVEISENLWQVVEPQLADGLTNTMTRNYFPVSRARNLEDKNELVPDILGLLLNNKIEFSKNL